MRILAAVLWLFFTGCLQGQSSLLIENIIVLSAENLESSSEKSVLITDGRIALVSDSPIEGYDDVQKLDGTGKFLTPGIIDSHVHVSSIPGFGFASESRSQQYPELIDAYFTQQPRSYLYFGVTQIIDPNPGASWRLFESSPIHPDFFHCEVVTSRTTFPFVEMPETIAEKLYPYQIDQNNTPEVLVGKIADSGAICVKLYFEDGYGNSSQWPLLSGETLQRITDAAHSRGLLVVVHANALDMYEKALEEDIDVVAHGLWNWGADNSFTSTPVSVVNMIGKLTENQVGFMPTLRVVAGLGELMEPDLINNVDFKNVTPIALREWYEQPDAQWFRSELLAEEDLTPQLFKRIYREGVVGRGIRAMQQLDNLGHPLLLGSDTPGSPSYINQPGLNTYLELLLMAEGGISLTKIFEAATINNARQFGLDDDYGTVEVGKIANLLILNKNPLETVEAWNSISMVVLKGEIIERGQLTAN